MMHTAFVLSVRGIPQLYYGEEIGMEGKEDPDNRRDFPVAAFKAEGRNAKEQQMFDWTRAWIRLRREHLAMRSGKLIDLFADDDAYVFARELGSEMVIVAFNRDRNVKRVTLPVKGKRLEPIIGDVKAQVVNGEAELNLPAQSATALRVFWQDVHD